MATQKRGRKVKEVEDPNNTWDMQLMAAVVAHNPEEAEALLAKGANINHVVADNGKTLSPFLTAAMKGDTEMMQWLVGKDANPNQEVEPKLHLLHWAVRCETTEALEKIMSVASTLPTMNLSPLDAVGLTPAQLAIHLQKPDAARVLIRGGAPHMFAALVDATHNQAQRAARTGDVAVLDTLVCLGDNINQRDTHGQTLLHLALPHQPQVADMLLERGLSINTPNAHGRSPLIHLITSGCKVEHVDMVLSRGADINLGDSMGITPLMHAISVYNTDVVKRLLDAKPDLGAKDAFGATAVHWAAVARGKSVLELLLNMECDVNVADKAGETPLHRACFHDKQEQLAVLLARENIDLNAATEHGETPLHVAAAEDHVECIAALLKRSAEQEQIMASSKKPDAKKKPAKDAAAAPEVEKKLNLEVEDSRSWTPLQTALNNGQKAAAELLMNSGCAVQRSSPRGTLLHEAVYRRFESTVTLLLSHGASVTATNTEDETPLHLSVRNNDVPISTLLIEGGAGVNARDSRTVNSPLHVACEHGNASLVAFLLGHGANPNLRNKRVQTPLHIASALGGDEIVAMLLEKQSNVDAADHIGMRPLHAACENDHAGVVAKLLAAGATISAVTAKKMTPLLLAISAGATSCAQLLVDHGADVTQADGLDRYPLLLAAEFHRPEIAKLLVRKHLDSQQRNAAAASGEN